MKDKLQPSTPDTPETTTNNIPCDQCNHPKSYHRQKKYYCMAEVMYNDPVNNNEPIKALCSCTNFVNAEDEAKKKKDKEQKEKEKEKPPKMNQQSPKPKINEEDNNTAKQTTSQIEPPIIGGSGEVK